MDRLSVFEPWRTAHRRTAWVPVVGIANSRSHFGGVPLVPIGSARPTCGVCTAPMALLVQLDLATLPADSAVAGSGLLQVFYCTNPDCEQDGEGWGPFADCHLTRVVAGERVQAAPPSPPDFPERFIGAWRPVTDLPDPEDHDALGIVYDYDFRAGTVRIACPDLAVQVDGRVEENLAEGLAVALDGDKLGGWPKWVQGPEYPSCPKCGARMGFVLQIDSEDNVPWMWGDLGIATVTRCPNHPEVLTLGWACG